MPSYLDKEIGEFEEKMREKFTGKNVTKNPIRNKHLKYVTTKTIPQKLLLESS